MFIKVNNTQNQDFSLVTMKCTAFQVLNLFLALLLNAFDTSGDAADEEERENAGLAKQHSAPSRLMLKMKARNKTPIRVKGVRPNALWHEMQWLNKNSVLEGKGYPCMCKALKIFLLPTKSVFRIYFRHCPKISLRNSRF